MWVDMWDPTSVGKEKQNMPYKGMEIFHLWRILNPCGSGSKADNVASRWIELLQLVLKPVPGLVCQQGH